MKPFAISEACRVLVDHYPSSDVVRGALQSAAQDEVAGFLRLWITEGIPFAFRDRPLVYEAVRYFIGRQLNVSAKQLTVVGSARIGYSLAPKKWSRAFGVHSDLDIAAVSRPLFDRLTSEYRRWAEDYHVGSVTPRSGREKSIWDENFRRNKQNVARGFLDSWKVPTFYRYPEAQRVGQTMYLLKEKLDATDGAPRIKMATVRVYADWDSFAGQMLRNLTSALAA